MGTENSKGLYFWRWGREGGESEILMHNLSKVILPNVCVGLLPSSFGQVFFTGHIPPVKSPGGGDALKCEYQSQQIK